MRFHPFQLYSCRCFYSSVISDPFDAHSGEVYVLNDGGEVDLDLGNYERYLDVTLSKDNNITTGKIYREVIDKEVGQFSPLLYPGTACGVGIDTIRYCMVR